MINKIKDWLRAFFAALSIFWTYIVLEIISVVSDKLQNFIMVGGDIYYTSHKHRKKNPKIFSLYVGLAGAIIIGASLSLVVFVTARFGTEVYLDRVHMSPENVQARHDKYMSSLEAFIAENEITSKNIYLLGQWTDVNKYVFISVYSMNDEPLFSTDDPPPMPEEEEKPDDLTDPSDPENPGTGNGEENPGDTTDPDNPDDPEKPDDEDSEKEEEKPDNIGGIITRPTLNDILEQMESITAHKIVNTVDENESLMIKIYEYEEYFYRDIFNVLSYVLAMIVLAAIIVEHFRRIIARIKKLQFDVNEVAGGRLEHPIVATGIDEITQLSYDVDNMRTTMLENIEKERQVLQMNTELITSMSHDIRTPLTVLMGYVDIMKSDLPPEELKEYILASEKTIQRLKLLSDDMFKYFRAFGKGAEGITIEDYDAATLFEQMLAEHVLLLGESGYKTEYNIDEVLESYKIVKTDAPHLMRIVDNIFSNIIKYADIEKEVYITGKIVEDKVVFEFKNTVKLNSEAESSKVGLKTCKRLSEYILDSFEWGEDDGIFTLTFSLLTHEQETKISESFYI